MAACKPDDLAGRWDSYTAGNTEDEPFWERCEIRFSSTGTILSGSTCRTDTGERSSLSGRFVLNSNCRITATLTQQFPGEKPNVCEIPQATLTSALVHPHRTPCASWFPVRFGQDASAHLRPQAER